MAKSINRLMAELIDDDGDVKLENLDEAPTGLDSAQVTTIAEGATMTVYDSLSLLPISSLTAGSQAFVKSNKRLYVSNGSGWYNVALVNLTPTMSLDQSGTVVLSTEGVATTVTITAQDSDNPDAILSYSVESDGNGVGNYTLSQDSSVFTITPLTEDSGATAGTFTLTFKTTDNINTATSDLDFSLTFSSIVDSSAETVLLMKADGNSATNAAITYQDSSDVSTGFTETGDPQAGTFSPYRSGGYSAYFDGDGDFLSVSSSDVNIKTLSASNFTVEGWFYKDDTQKNIFLFAQRGASGTSYSGIQLAVNISGYMALLGATDLVSWDVSITGSTLVTEHEWHHFAVVKNSTTYTLYLDGASQGTSTAGTLVYASGNPALVIGTVWSSSSSQYDWHGYIKDFRVSDNARYTTAFTPPTEPFESDSNTELLACSLPYFGDASSTDATITVNGNAHTKPFGPYDYGPWADDHGGSIYLDGGANLNSETNLTTVVGNYTVEFWLRPWDNLTDQQTILHFNAGSNGGTNIWYGGSSGANIRVDNGTVGQSSFTGKSLVLHTWNHVAITRSSTTTTCYINGKSAGSHTYTPAASNRLVVGRYSSVAYFCKAYIADLRYVPGSVVYTAAFTPPTAPLGHITNTDLLMNNKSDANVYDAAAANGLTLVGNTSSATAERKFTTSSAVSFDGSGDYISENNSDLFAFGTGDFTVEAWIYYSTFSGSGGQAIVSTGTSTSSASAGHWYLTAYGASDLRFGRHGSSQYNSATTSTLSVNTWHHLAVTRAGTTVRFFIDGVQPGGAAVSGGIGSYDFNNSSGYLFVGEGASFSSANGYIQDLRITKGYARYTGAFTPPTAEFEL